MDVAESDEVSSSNGGDCKDGIIERLLRFKNLNEAISYLTPNTRQVFTQLRQVFIEAPIL